MKHNSSAITGRPPVLSNAGPAWGLLGVLAFSLTVPLTRIAVTTGGLSPGFVGAGRAVVAAALAAGALVLTRQTLPRGRQWLRLAVVGAGVVAGFPLLTSYALTSAPASHGAVVIALLPAATAVVAVLRTRERTLPRFWVTAAIGAAAAIGFAAISGGSLGSLHTSDLLLLGAVVAAAVGYAEGGLLARELGAWQTVSWALVISAPVMLGVLAMDVSAHPVTGTASGWAAFGYVSVISMYLGFFAWYRGLAIGPMTQVSQTQLVQPVLSIGWAALLIGEALTWPTVLGGAAVIACAAGAVRSRGAGAVEVPAVEPVEEVAGMRAPNHRHPERNLTVILDMS